MDDTTNQAVSDDTSAEDTVADDTGVEAESETEPQYDDDGNLIEPEPEDEEVDLDDLKLKVPKDQAQKVREAMLRQADYTRKTQELAEQRKADAAERERFQQATQAELNVYAIAMNAKHQLAQYANVDWAYEINRAQWEYDQGHEDRRSHVQAAKAQAEQLERTYNGAFAQLGALEQQRLSLAQQETAKRMEETRIALAKDIPGWSGELEAKLTDFGVTRYGFSAEEVADIKIDPRIAKVLHDAFKGQEAAQKQQVANRHLQAQQAQPAATVRANSGPPKGLDDRLSMDEWMKRREKQVAAKAAR